MSSRIDSDNIQEFAARMIKIKSQKDLRFTLHSEWQRSNDPGRRWIDAGGASWHSKSYYLPIDAAEAIYAAWPRRAGNHRYGTSEVYSLSSIGVAGILKLLTKLGVDIDTIERQREEDALAYHIETAKRNIKSAASDLLIIVTHALEHELVTAEEVAIVKRLADTVTIDKVA